jgi:integrase
MPIYRRETPQKDGSITVRYRADAGRDPVTGNRKGRRKDFELRRDAVEWLHNKEKPVPAPGTITLCQLGERFIQSRKSLNRERSTYEKYEQHFRNHLNSLVINHPELAGVRFGNVPVGRIQPRHLVIAREQLSAKLSAAMLNKVWATLTYALDYAVALEELKLNPISSIKIEKGARRTSKQVKDDEDRPDDIPSERDLGILLAAIDFVENAKPTLGQVFVSLEARAGLRPSEARAITWPDLSLNGPFPYVDVNKRVDEYGMLGDLKTKNAHRKIPLPPELVSMLTAWREICPRNQVVEVVTGRRGTKWERCVMKNLNPRDLVFPTSNGGYQNPSNLHNRVWVPLQIALGLKEPVLTASGIQELDKSGKGKFKHRYRLYALRHVFASVKIKLGTSAKQLQMLMGHSSVQFHNGCLRSPVAR